MAHTPTNWQDYPATTTPIMAAELTRIDGDASQAYNMCDCFAGRTFSGTVEETVAANEGIASSGRLKISDDDITDTAGAIVRCSRTTNNTETKWIVPMTDYTMEYIIGLGTHLRFPSTTYFNLGDVVTALIYMPGVPGAQVSTQGMTQQLLTGTQTGYSAGIAYPVNDEIIDGEVWQ